MARIPLFVKKLAERVGFEPTRRVFARLLDFESSAFNPSAISP